jgi:hypothetical protein
MAGASLWGDTRPPGSFNVTSEKSHIRDSLRVALLPRRHIG